jgi:hypothetical protein
MFLLQGTKKQAEIHFVIAKCGRYPKKLLRRKRGDKTNRQKFFHSISKRYGSALRANRMKSFALTNVWPFTLNITAAGKQPPGLLVTKQQHSALLHVYVSIWYTK